MKVNVIVPVFNTEISKLQRCFDSICVAQNKSIANLEIECLIIDDGSEEKYTSWCSEYVKYHNNFKLYKKKNGGVSSARNYGIAKADGDYICFVDSDDVITANTFREIPFDQNFDLIMTDLEFVDGNNKEVWSVLPNIKGKLQVEQIVWRLTQDGKVNGPYCKFIKNKFLKENRIEFKTCVVLGEDLLFLMNILECLPRIYYIPKVTYIYYIDSSTSDNRLKKNPEIIIKNNQCIYNEMFKLINKIFKDGEGEKVQLKATERFIKQLFNTAAEVIIFGLFTKENKKLIKKSVDNIKNRKSVYEFSDLKTKIRLKILDKEDWRILGAIGHIRTVYLKAKRLL